MRTLITLDVLGKVEQFSTCFDIKKYKHNRAKAFAWLLETKEGDMLDDNAVFARDIYQLVLKNRVSIPHTAYSLYRKKKAKTKAYKGYQAIKKCVKRIIK